MSTINSRTKVQEKKALRSVLLITVSPVPRTVLTHSRYSMYGFAYAFTK